MDAEVTGLRLDLRCRLDASPERVFRMLTEPAELVRWWGPHGFTLLEAEVDARAGGGYRFSMKPPEGDPFHLSGKFLEVDPPSRLAYTFRYEEPTPDDRETVVTLRIDRVGEAVEILLSQGRFATEERLALHRDGWSDSFDRLAAALDG